MRLRTGSPRGRLACFIAFSALVASPAVLAQTPDSPMNRFRPIGSPSAVDQFKGPTQSTQLRETAYQHSVVQQQGGLGIQPRGSVRQAAMLQQGATGMQLPGNFNSPPLPVADPVPNDGQPVGQPQLPAGTQMPPGQVPRALPGGSSNSLGNLTPVPVTPGAVASSSDYAPMVSPQLNDGFATIGNCNCISPPSNYIAASGPCAPVTYVAPQSYVAAPQTYVAPPAEIAAPAVVPATAIPTTTVPGTAVVPARDGIPRKSLISFGQEAYPVQVGQGVFGQPVAYVPGQRFRNWIRYFFP